MTKEELIENLGTIAKSGSKAFLEKVNEKGDVKDSSSTVEAATGIIGKFGVGFYSAFMVGDKIDVYTRSATNGNENHVWRSDGTGSFEVAPTDSGVIQRGSKVVIHLKESCKEYAEPKHIESVIRKYSNFVSFPIILNDKPINTVQALWTMDPKDTSDEQYTEFYKYIANAFDEPMYRLNFKADAPIELKSLFFVGSSHMEKHGYGRLEPGVSLYSRKVLIERNSKDVLPEWLRFVKGAVDSEDLPLSLSRESMQDSRLLTKIKTVLTRRILKFFDQQAKSDSTQYDLFFKEFGQFLKEGLCSDFMHKDAIAKLMRYESSTTDAGKTTSLDEYVSRSPPDADKTIYYLCSPNRELALASPYYESFKKEGIEVLFVYGPMDDFVMSNIGEYNQRKVISAEIADIGNDDKDDSADDDDLSKKGDDKTLSKMSNEEANLFSAWLKLQLAGKVKDVKITTRLTDSPAMITEHESASVRRMMAMINNDTNNSAGATSPMAAKHVLEINAKHPIMLQLNMLRANDVDLSSIVAEQIYDNAAMAAGLIDDGRTMLPRLNTLLEKLMSKKQPISSKVNESS